MRAAQNATSGGARDTEMNELTTSACGAVGLVAVTTATPVG